MRCTGCSSGELILPCDRRRAAANGAEPILADRHREDVFAAHTHNQPAQPSTLPITCWVIEQLERDAIRLRAAYDSTTQNPLGAARSPAQASRVDRQRTTALLGFDGATGNTYGSIATVDYLLESVSATAVLLAGLGRVVQDLLLWCTSEFGYLRLSDGFVQRSSIMPQKRNPVALEHARAIASKALGQTTAIILSVHKHAVGDIVDKRTICSPRVVDVQGRRKGGDLVAAGMGSAEFNRERLAEPRGAGMDHRNRTRRGPLSRAITACRSRKDTRSRRGGGPAHAREPGASIADFEQVFNRGPRPCGGRYGGRALAELLSPQHFVSRADDAWAGPRAVGNRARARTCHESPARQTNSGCRDVGGKLRAAEESLLAEGGRAV